MNNNPNVIWRKGDGEMPKHAKRIVELAQDELLLSRLNLPFEIVDMIRNNSNKNEQTINDYISEIVVRHFITA